MPTSCGTRGVFVVNYPQDGIQNGSPDAIALVDSFGTVLDFVSYEGVNAPAVLRPAAFDQHCRGGDQQHADWQLAAAEFRRHMGAGRIELRRVQSRGTDSGRQFAVVHRPCAHRSGAARRLRRPDLRDAAQPDQRRDPDHHHLGRRKPPQSRASIQNGVMHALAAGTATCARRRPTARRLPTRCRHASQWRAARPTPGNAEFGEPADSDASDDFIVRHEQFTASYNPNRGTPNWVSYDLDAAHFGAEDRCDCFTMDAELPSTLTAHLHQRLHGLRRVPWLRHRSRPHGAFVRPHHGQPRQRAHLLFSNIVPQAADMNQGPWANLENDLGDLARVQGREVYIITGVAGNKGTLKNEGKVVIPTSTWKVAVIMPHDQGLANIVRLPRSRSDRGEHAERCRHTQRATGTPTARRWMRSKRSRATTCWRCCPTRSRAAVESNTQPPFASLTGPAGAIAEGGSATFDASASVDPNGTIVSYAWDFGDGSTGSGASVVAYLRAGRHIHGKRDGDRQRWPDRYGHLHHQRDQRRAGGGRSAGCHAECRVRHTPRRARFTDPGADAWTATVNWGDGSAPEVVPLSGHSFSFTHIYTAGGTYR